MSDDVAKSAPFLFSGFLFGIALSRERKFCRFSSRAFGKYALDKIDRLASLVGAKVRIAFSYFRAFMTDHFTNDVKRYTFHSKPTAIGMA